MRRLLLASLMLACLHAQAQTPPSAQGLTPASTSTPPPAPESGQPFVPAPDFGAHSTCATALRLTARTNLEGLRAEDQWMREHYPRHFVFDRHEITCDKKPATAVVLMSATEHAIIVTFDTANYRTAR